MVANVRHKFKNSCFRFERYKKVLLHIQIKTADNVQLNLTFLVLNCGKYLENWKYDFEIFEIKLPKLHKKIFLCIKLNIKTIFKSVYLILFFL